MSETPNPPPNAVLYEERARVALIRYNRPHARNAWNVPLTREVIAAINRANADEQIGAIVISAVGETFCAGVDLKAPPEPADESGRSPNPATLTMGQGEANWLHLLNRSKPCIVAVNGAAIGLGATHILAADIRVASTNATFSFPFLRLGAMPECASTALLGRLVGLGRAMDLCLRAREIDAREALSIGLVTELFEPSELLESALALGERIASYPSLQAKLTKRMMWQHAGEFDADAIMKRESSTFVEMLRARGRKQTFQ
jgi:enoyl-CoA hydratase/carnithine racemase